MAELNPYTQNKIVASCVGEPGQDGMRGLPPQWQKQRQYFGSYRVDDGFGFDTPLIFNEPFFQSNGELVTANLGAPTWWTIQIYGYELARVAEGADVVRPLNRDSLINSAQPTTRLKARIYTEDMEVPRYVDVDIGGGIRLAVCSSNLRVEPLVPALSLPASGVGKESRVAPLPCSTTAFVEVDKNNTQQAIQYGLNGGTTVDALVSASLTPCHAPIGDRFATLTYRAVATADDPFPLPLMAVPPGAKRVTIYNDDPDLAIWQWYETTNLAGTAGAGILSDIVWGTGPAPNVVTLPVPGLAQYLGRPAAPVQVPFARFTIVWHLEW